MKSPATETFVSGKIDIFRVFFFFWINLSLSRAQDKLCTPLTTLKRPLGNRTEGAPKHLVTIESHHVRVRPIPDKRKHHATAEHFTAWFGFPPAASVVRYEKGGDTNDHAAGAKAVKAFQPGIGVRKEGQTAQPGMPLAGSNAGEGG
jgi:hypothetical protein